ncbi:hypothetical protein HYH02_005381 [Chlamydomonas schloesseri]|uniref:EF-hand domain-containing protein n=1 Tax=Chlamydomonas schloesseri TaxID=2026947 RepID=A0A836B7M5_9CHLO|nr:hypothetical protein HYH02_005381 [Chlamydomonas schloesseri]|eukprot:KAG2449858.1 hypothetical protein HYH02_005381 [Chlamydomonas schloesseri]
MAGRGPGGPSKAQQDKWNEQAMQLMKRHDQNGDGLLDPREMASAVNELCGTHGFSARSLTASLGLDQKLENSAYRWSPVEFSDLYRRVMLMTDTGGGGGGGGTGNAGADRLMGQAVDALRDLDAKTEANLKQCYNNYCRLTVAGGGKMMMDGDLKLSSSQWHQLCADVGLAQPVGPVPPADLGNIFAAASQRTSGLTLKQFLTALAMISPDLTTLTNHLVAQLGPQLRPRAGGDAPQPACFPLRNLDLKSQAAQAHWGVAQGVMSAANAFMKAGVLNGGGGGAGFAGAISAALQGAASGGGYPIEIEDASRQQRGGSGFASPAHTRGSAEPLSPIVGGPITAKLGGSGIKRSSLASMGGSNALGSLRTGSVNGSKGLDMPSNQMVLLDRLAAAEARITQLEQQQSFTREMMQAATAGGAAFAAAGGGGGRAPADGGGMQAASAPQVMALEAKLVAMEAELARVSPGADAPRLFAEVRDNLDLLSQKVEALTKTVERMGKKVESCESTSKAAEEGVRALQAPIQEATSGLASVRQVTDSLRSGVVSKETELMTTLVSRLSTAEGNIEALDGQLRKALRDGKVNGALPSKEALAAALAAGGYQELQAQQAAGTAPPAPSTPTSNGPSEVKEAPMAASTGQLKPGAAAGGERKGDDYFVQTLGVVQLDSEEDIRLQPISATAAF